MLEIRLLGQFDLTLDDTPVEIASRSAQAFLAYLVLNNGKSQRREKLAGLLWPEATEDNARTYLRQALWRVRKAIGDSYLLADRMTISFDSEADYQLDVTLLEMEPAEGWTVDTLVATVSVYEGDLLPGFYDDWVTIERERLSALYTRRMDALLNALVTQSRWEELLIWGERWIAMGSAPEPAYRALMIVHARQGDQASVVSVYQRCVDLLDQELGVEPSVETHELYLRLVSGEKPTHVIKESAGPAPTTYFPQKDEFSLRTSASARLPEDKSVGPNRTSEEARPTPLVGLGMDQEIRFCTAPDGVRIAYATAGEGPPLVRAATYLTHLEYDWNSPVWRHWLEGLAKHHTLVRYDQRGCGLSDWNVDDFSLNADVQDLETVVDNLGLNRFPLLGSSQSGPVAIAYAVRYPEKVSHLILYGSYARGFLKQNPTPEQLEEAKVYLNLIKIGWGHDNPAFRQVFSSMFLPEGTPEQISWFNDLQRISAPPENTVKRDKASYELDVSDLAPRVAVPTLVIHARNDAAVFFERGRELAALIPNARFVSLESKNHILLATEPAWPRFLAKVNRFLGTRAGSG